MLLIQHSQLAQACSWNRRAYREESCPKAFESSREY